MKAFLHKSIVTLGLFLGLLLPNFRATADTLTRGPEFSGPTKTAPAPAVTFSGPISAVRPTPVVAVNEITLEKAREVFAAMAAQTDISFQYAWDGCFARSHVMIRRMQALGLEPQQAYIRENGTPLVVKTPHATITWRYHVAPVLRVNVAGKSEWMVIDPSLFSDVVTVKEWAAKQKGTTRLEPRVDVVPVGRRVFADGSAIPGAGLSDSLAQKVMSYLMTLDPRYPPPNDWFERLTRPGLGGLSRVGDLEPSRQVRFEEPIFAMAA